MTYRKQCEILLREVEQTYADPMQAEKILTELGDDVIEKIYFSRRSIAQCNWQYASQQFQALCALIIKEGRNLDDEIAAVHTSPAKVSSPRGGSNKKKL